MSILHLEGFGYRGGAAGMALDYTIGGGGTLTETTMPLRRLTCFAASMPDVSINRPFTLVGPSIITGFAFQWTSGAGTICHIKGDANTTTQCSLAITSGGLLKIYRGDDGGTELAAASGGTELVPGGVYFINCTVTVDSSAGSFLCRVYPHTGGGFLFQTTGSNTRNGSATDVGGLTLYGPAGGALFADWYVVDPDPSTGHNIAALLPDRMRIDCYLPYTWSTWADLASYPGTGGGSGEREIDETAPNGDTDYIYSSIAGQRSLFKFGPMTHNPQSIIATSIIATARKDDSGDRSLTHAYRRVGDLFNGTIFLETDALTTSYANYRRMYALGSGGGHQFPSQDLLNDTGFGFEVV